MRRAGFGATPDQISAMADQDLGTLVNSLVGYEQTTDSFSPPPDSILNFRQMGAVQADFNALSAWWIGQMLTTARPLQENMTLFWHGHFATGFAKVRSTLLMYRQNQLFRQNALGRFDDILSAVYKDPAMLIWLDGRLNTKAAPNENWGREVMELFTIGRGNYTEDDVHANSRSFTGWRVTAAGDAEFVPRLHDTGVKTLLGQTGNWDGEDAVRILAAHPATGPFLATKLWRFFASDSPPASATKKLAQVYYNSDHSIGEMVRTLFTLPEFYAPATRTGHIKSPTEFVVTALRQLGLSGVSSVELQVLPRTLALLGQELFNPPNVGGWPGGATWINAATMLGRFNFAAALTGDGAGGHGFIDTNAIVTSSNAFALTTDAMSQRTAREIMATLVAYVADMLGLELTGSTWQALQTYAGPFDDKTLDTKVRGLIHLALISPEFQAS
jgi:uncharacterized protein (DUF1800 family)